MANPYKWTEAIEDELLKRVAKGEAVRNICNDEWMPSAPTLYKRMDADEAFAKRYARAKERHADALFEECLAIADSQEGDVIIVDGVEQRNYDLVQRARLRIDTRKWMAGKLRPKVYGDKTDVNLTGSFNVTIGKDDADL
jgi:hypothetical protein